MYICNCLGRYIYVPTIHIYTPEYNQFRKGKRRENDRKKKKMNEIVRARSTYFSIRDTSKGEGGGAVIGQSISSTAHSLSVFIYIYIHIHSDEQTE